MFPSPRSYRVGLAALLVAAPLADLVETLLSPLGEGSTADDLRAIAGHQSAFAVSVLVGVLATVLFVPAFLGLATVAAERSPLLSAVGGTAVVLSMLGFMGVRMLQAFELETVRQHLNVAQAARLVDGAADNPIGTPIAVLFLGGTVVGVVCLALAVGRARLAPLPAVAMLLAFPFADLLSGGHLGTVVAHAMLLVGLGWIGLAQVRQPVAEIAAVVAPAV